jgi:hypothetical protein
MKNFKEEIEAMKAQIAALENNLVCADGQCGCGCDEAPVEVEDQGPEFDGAGFSEADRTEEPYVKTISGGYMNVGEAIAVFTREELIDFAAKLMERTVQACKEAVSDTDFEADYICSLELNYNNQIEVEIDNGVIRDAVSSEIDNTIELDNDSVEVEVDNILRDMLKQS